MLTIEERKASVDAFLRDTKTCVDRTTIPEVREIWALLRAHACYAEPVPSAPGMILVNARGGIFSKDAQRRSLKLHIAPVYAEDTGRFGPIWDTLLAAKGEAVYFCLAHLIVLRPESSETSTARGCTVLHEGGHALRAARKGRAGQSTSDVPVNEVLHEEREMHALEGKLWREAGSAVFDDALARAVYWIEKEIRRGREKVGRVFHGLAHYPARLDELLGTAPTAEARETRKLHLEILANFEVVNRSALPNKRAVQAAMIHSVYERIGFTGRI